MNVMAAQMTSLKIVYWTVYTGADQRKHQSVASLAFVRELNSPHKGPVTRKLFPFDDVIMILFIFLFDWYEIPAPFKNPLITNTGTSSKSVLSESTS